MTFRKDSNLLGLLQYFFERGIVTVDNNILFSRVSDLLENSPIIRSFTQEAEGHRITFGVPPLQQSIQTNKSLCTVVQYCKFFPFEFSYQVQINLCKQFNGFYFTLWTFIACWCIIIILMHEMQCQCILHDH